MILRHFGQLSDLVANLSCVQWPGRGRLEPAPAQRRLEPSLRAQAKQSTRQQERVDCFVRLAFVVLKKDLLVALELDDLPGLSRRYKQITAGFQNAAWALLAHYIYDLIDPTYDPTRAMQTWLRVADDRVELHS